MGCSKIIVEYAHFFFIRITTLQINKNRGQTPCVPDNRFRTVSHRLRLLALTKHIISELFHLQIFLSIFFLQFSVPTFLGIHSTPIYNSSQVGICTILAFQILLVISCVLTNDLATSCLEFNK